MKTGAKSLKKQLGSQKFRYRKEEAARKLAATEENLVRIRDLYTELAHQAEPLAEQAEKAKQYMELRDELRTWEVSLWLDGLTKLRADTEKNQQDTADCAAQLNKARTEQDRLYAQSEQLTKELRDADAAADDLRQQMHTTEQNRAELSSRCAVLEANLKNNAQNRERIQKEQARQAEQARSLAEQAAVHLARQAELAAACETLAQTVQQIQLEDAQAGAQAESLQQERSAIDARKAKNEQTRFEAELARTAAKTGLSGMDSRKEYLAAELEQAAAQLAEQTAVCKISENKLETCRQEQETLRETSVPDYNYAENRTQTNKGSGVRADARGYHRQNKRISKIESKCCASWKRTMRAFLMRSSVSCSRRGAER